MSLLGRLVPPIPAMLQAWSGRYQTRGSLEQADCLIGFSFGYRGRRDFIQPGLSNLDLANVAKKHYDALPKVLQFEIAEAYEQEYGHRHRDSSQIITISEPQKLKYAYLTAHQLDTLEVADQAIEIMRRHNWKTALLLAHPCHLPRVQAVCTKLGIEWVCDLAERGSVEFDPLSAQRWTRSLGIWRLYEPVALMYYRVRGWL